MNLLFPPTISNDVSKLASQSNRQRLWFVSMWYVWAVLLGGSLLGGDLSWGHSSTVAMSMRLGSSFVLVATGWMAVFYQYGSTVGRYAVFVAIGMTLGAIGDLFNADCLNFIPLPDPVLGGIVAFGLGHIAYIAGCLLLSRQVGRSDRKTFVISVVCWQLFGLIAWYFVALAGTKARDLVWPSLPYTALLAGTAGITSGMALQHRRFVSLALGGALFLSSDLILACSMFRGRFPHQTVWIWLTYGVGQMLIVFSVLSATIERDVVNIEEKRTAV